MNTLRDHAWRVTLVCSAVLLVLGGRMHPSSHAEDPLREELAHMTADDSWVPGHTLIAISTILLATGLWAAYRRRVWPVGVRRALFFGAAAVSVYFVETLAHLGAALDSRALAAGDAAPIAWTHVGLSTVLYPVTGWAIAVLAWSMARAWHGPRRYIVGVGVVAGLLHALSVPLTILLPDTELSVVFAGAAILIAVWSLGTGLVGAPRAAAVERRSTELV